MRLRTGENSAVRMRWSRLKKFLVQTAEAKVHKMQVQKSGPSCIYVAIAGPKLAAGHFPQSEEQPICNQLVCFITVALKLLSSPSYITLYIFQKNYGFTGDYTIFSEL